MQSWIRWFVEAHVELYLDYMKILIEYVRYPKIHWGRCRNLRELLFFNVDFDLDRFALRSVR